MRVLVVGSAKPPGGMSTLINECVTSSIANKVDLTLFDNGKRTPARRSFFQGAISQLVMLKEYFGLLRSKKPHIVHIHSGGRFDFFRSAFYVFLARLRGARIVFHNHLGAFNDFYRNLGFVRRAFIRLTLNRCHSVIAFSEWWKQSYARITSPKRIHVLYNGIKSDPYEYNVHRNKARQILGIHRDKIVALAMSVKCRNKGSYDLLDAAPFIAKMDGSALILMVGPDEWSSKGTHDELVRLRAERKLDNVDIRGEADERMRCIYYAAADIFLLPTYYEGAPMSVLEAMAAHLPVISTPVGAIPEMVENGKTGILVQPARPGEISEAVAKLTKNATLRREMSEAGYRRFRRMFDLERVTVPALWSIYTDLVPGFRHHGQQAAQGTPQQAAPRQAAPAQRPPDARRQDRPAQAQPQRPDEAPSERGRSEHGRPEHGRPDRGRQDRRPQDRPAERPPRAGRVETHLDQPSATGETPAAGRTGGNLAAAPPPADADRGQDRPEAEDRGARHDDRRGRDGGRRDRGSRRDRDDRRERPPRSAGGTGRGPLPPPVVLWRTPERRPTKDFSTELDGKPEPPEPKTAEAGAAAPPAAERRPRAEHGENDMEQRLESAAARFDDDHEPLDDSFEGDDDSEEYREPDDAEEDDENDPFMELAERDPGDDDMEDEEEADEVGRPVLPPGTASLEHGPAGASHEDVEHEADEEIRPAES